MRDCHLDMIQHLNMTAGLCRDAATQSIVCRINQLSIRALSHSVQHRTDNEFHAMMHDFTMSCALPRTYFKMFLHFGNIVSVFVWCSTIAC